MREIWPQLKAWVDAEEPFVLATVVGGKRPAPRGIGAVMAIHRDGEQFIGSVSAGCVEIEVLEAARACLADGKTRHAVFSGEHGFPWEVSMSCGGQIRIRVDLFHPHPEGYRALAQILDGEEKDLRRDAAEAVLDASGEVLYQSGDPAPADLATAREHLQSGQSTVERESEGGSLLLRVIEKPARFFIIGAVHISVHLVALAKSCGYETVVIDPREVYARRDRFPVPPDRLLMGWPSRHLPDFALGPADCAAVITHDPKIDDDALKILLSGNCGYVGALGSRKNQQARKKRLRKELDAPAVERIHGPIGLDIGNETPAEIAVSIMAEVIQERPQ